MTPMPLLRARWDWAEGVERFFLEDYLQPLIDDRRPPGERVHSGNRLAMDRRRPSCPMGACASIDGDVGRRVVVDEHHVERLPAAAMAARLPVANVLAPGGSQQAQAWLAGRTPRAVTVNATSQQERSLRLGNGWTSSRRRRIGRGSPAAGLPGRGRDPGRRRGDRSGTAGAENDDNSYVRSRQAAIAPPLALIVTATSPPRNMEMPSSGIAEGLLALMPGLSDMPPPWSGLGRRWPYPGVPMDWHTLGARELTA